MLFVILLRPASKETEWGKKVSIQMEKLRCDSPPFNAVPSCNIVHSESTKEGLHFFVLSSFLIIKNRSSRQWRPLVTMTWLFLNLFTFSIHGVQSDPENELPSFGSGWKALRCLIPSLGGYWILLSGLIDWVSVAEQFGTASVPWIKASKHCRSVSSGQEFQPLADCEIIIKS